MRNNRSRRSSRLTNESSRNRGMRRRISERYIVESKRDDIIRELTEKCKDFMDNMDVEELEEYEVVDLLTEVWGTVVKESGYKVKGKQALNLMIELDLTDWSDLDFYDFLNWRGTPELDPDEEPTSVEDVVGWFFTTSFFNDGVREELVNYQQSLIG